MSVLALVIVAVVIIGAMLPKAHVATRTAIIGRNQAEAFALIRERAARETEYKVVEETPPRRLVTRVVDGLPYGGSWTIELVPQGTETRVTITENGEVYNPVFRFVSRFVIGHTATIDKYLAGLGARAQQ